MEHPELYAQLIVLPLGRQSAALSFTGRLARENRWSMRQAARVVTEYRRFLYLAATAPSGSAVTPSSSVDQAWHLHLTYTRDYWDGLCAGLLGRPLHHQPTEGGADQSARFRRQYEETLVRYRTEFGEDAPADIWPAVEDRFAARPCWVDVSRNVILPRRPLILAGSGVSVASLASCASLGSEDVERFIVIGLILGAGLLLLLRGMVFGYRRERKRKGDAGCSTGSDGSTGSDSSDSGCGSGCGGD